ncbi:resolvase [Pseudanabaena sp. FACHB-2040]|uniref:resolvase n=1 Tax=Pseudanabaena sp. FACHB-2040 TaxID=2692859 RepID=UPI001F5513D6|nr:resolvase [Pseudanabaena sp. FACHB-2040]
MNPDSTQSSLQSIVSQAAPSVPNDEPALLTVEDVQKQLKRSRASVYRYANTDSELLNPPFDPQKLNPEVRTNREDPLLFHPKEVRRFARDVLGLNPTIEVQTPPETVTQELLRAILLELQSIHELLKSRS